MLRRGEVGQGKLTGGTGAKESRTMGSDPVARGPPNRDNLAQTQRGASSGSFGGGESPILSGQTTPGDDSVALDDFEMAINRAAVVTDQTSGAIEDVMRRRQLGLLNVEL